MNCPFDKEKLTGYYDGELGADEKAEVERHIASCSECLRELGELKSAALLVKELPRLRAPRSIAEGVAREIQAAGKVHRFAKVRRNVLWVCAAAAAALVVLNVAYFTSADRSPSAAEPMARSVAPSIAAAKAPDSVPSAPPADAARRSADRAEEDRSIKKLSDARQLVEAKKAAQEEVPAREKGAAAPVVKAEPSKSKENAAKLDAEAPAAPPAPKPAATPAPAPPPPAPLEAAKEPARPTEAPAEKPAMKKEADLLAKQDSDAKAKPPAEPPPTHLTLVSTQLSNDRKSVDEALRKMGVRTVAAAPVAPKGPATRGRDDSSMTLELTDRQIARLQQELNKAGRSQVIVGSPGDPVLAQFSDGGLLRGRKDVASGGATAPAPRKSAEAPKAEAAKAPGAAEKETEESAGKPLPEAAADKAGEPRRKVILHLLEVPVVPDPQPAPDPVKK